MTSPPGSLARTLWHNFLRVVCRTAFVALYGMRVAGREHVPNAGGLLVCSNHQSHFDPVLIGLAVDRRLNYLARDSLFRFLPLRLLIQSLDAIPIERDGFGLAGIKETLKRLKRGEAVLIFPEGTRTPDGAVQPLKPGFAALARRARVPLLPAAIDGAFEAWPRSSPLPRLAKICIVFGQPITPMEVESMSDEELVATLAARIDACHRQARSRRLEPA
jgi:1-acyl-sn-glycerol-3-phosphate acyltransferase